MILIKERQWKLILLRMVFSDYTTRRILFYHTKGYYAPTIVGLLQKEDIQVSGRSVSDFLIRFKQTLSLRTYFLLFLATLAQNCTAGHGFRLDLDFFTRAGVRRYLNSNANNFLLILIYTHVRMCDVHKTERTVHGLFSARLWSVQYPFESRLT